MDKKYERGIKGLTDKLQAYKIFQPHEENKMSAVKVEYVHKVSFETKDHKLVFAKTPEGVRISTSYKNSNVIACLIPFGDFKALMAAGQDLVHNTNVKPAVKTETKLVVQEKVAAPAIKKKTKKKPNKSGKKMYYWDEQQVSIVAEVLGKQKGTWEQAAQASGRTPEAILRKVYKGQIPGVTYSTVIKTAGPAPWV